MRILVTGSSGYFAGVLIPVLLQGGHDILGLDKEPSQINDPNYDEILLDLLDNDRLFQVLENETFDAIIHLASEIDFAVRSQKSLFRNNVQMVKNLVELSSKRSLRSFVFTSSNSIFLGNPDEVIQNHMVPQPIDEYGKSKLEIEKILTQTLPSCPLQIVRCPNIVDAGRVGMLSILYELLKNDANLWVIGDGSVRHQTIFAKDLAVYILHALDLKTSNTVNIGSTNVPTFRETFERVAAAAGSKSKVRRIPKFLAIAALRASHRLGLSPLGPYQFRMLTQSFQFAQDWTKLPFPWKPTKTNVEMLVLAYEHYISSSTNQASKGSANSKPVKFGILKILRFLKW